MEKDYLKILQKKLDNRNLEKLTTLNMSPVINFVGKYVDYCNPKSVFVRTDASEDIKYIRRKAVDLGEEIPLKMEGHTAHFDGYFDQARDKENTKYLVSEKDSKESLNCIRKESGLKEINTYLENIMQGKEMIVGFFCLGPPRSDFSIYAVQITDSFYVAHSEDILYRPGYNEFERNKPKGFFKFVHSAGRLDEQRVSKDLDKRRIYIDLSKNIVYSVNTQYAGNTVGLKKLALRLAINKASKEGWLAEHMFIMGVNDEQKNKAYFCGAFPSLCGKTSTSMVEGESILGDDIAYLRIRNDKVYGANVERGIFGIIKDINSNDDRILFKTLHTPGERIFSNVLIDENKIPYWLGKDGKMPRKGVNFAGQWSPGKVDKQGKEIPPSHKNARFTIQLSSLENADPSLESAEGVEISGIIYGGRDSDTSMPVEEAFSWRHGIILKAASLESETTAATLGQDGVRAFNPMSNIDFLSVPLSRYLEMNLEFGVRASKKPMIFSVNYFLKDKSGKFLNDIEDKRVWLKWMRLRVDEKVDAIKTPVGFIPIFEDLKKLFAKVLKKEYRKEDYLRQFSVRIPENLKKIDRIRNIYDKVPEIPWVLFEELDAQQRRLEEAHTKFGNYMTPV